MLFDTNADAVFFIHVVQNNFPSRKTSKKVKIKTHINCRFK